MRYVEPQMGARDLAPNSFRVELKGHPKRVVWPAICARCGAPAHDRVLVRKVFLRRPYDGMDKYLVTGARIPFCASCIALHEQQAPTMSSFQRARTYVGTPMVIAFVGAGIASVGVFQAIGGASLSDPAARVPMLVAVGLALLALAGIPALAWSTRRFRVLPQTEVTRSCDFSDAIGNVLTGTHRIYAIRDRTFADELARLNRGQIPFSRGRSP